VFRTYSRSLPLLLIVLATTGPLAYAQEPIRVAVAVMQNQSPRSVSGALERDRLVQALNHSKPDKKTHVQLQAVALDATTGRDADDEAASKNCAYIVFTTLTELRSAEDPYQRVPNRIESNPNSQWSMQNNPRAQRMDPEYRVTVEYKLFRTGGSELSASPYSTQAATNEIDAVSQVMDRIALRVADEVKKQAAVAAKE
jgi:hypothetical protein